MHFNTNSTYDLNHLLILGMLTHYKQFPVTLSPEQLSHGSALNHSPEYKR